MRSYHGFRLAGSAGSGTMYLRYSLTNKKMHILMELVSAIRSLLMRRMKSPTSSTGSSGSLIKPTSTSTAATVKPPEPKSTPPSHPVVTSPSPSMNQQTPNSIKIYQEAKALLNTHQSGDDPFLGCAITV